MNFNEAKDLLTRTFDLEPEFTNSNKMSDLVDGMFAKKGTFNKDGETHVKLSIDVPKFAQFVKKHTKDGWLNLEIKTSKKGTLYASLDTFVPKKKQEDDLPF